MKAIFKRRSFRIAGVILSVAIIVTTVLLIRVSRTRHDERMTSQCANHAIQLRYVVMMLSEVDEPQEQFPSVSDTRAAFAKMSPMDADWLASFGSSCPEAFLRDKSIGYVLVADGLSRKVAVEQEALVLFCPADSHQRSKQHSHAVFADGGLLCVKSNAEMIELLRRETLRAQDGSVPYSATALSNMERELSAREGIERKRESKARRWK